MTELNAKQQAIVNKLVDDLKSVDDIQAIVLGGSFASGTATQQSDIDLGLYYHESNPFAIAALQTIAEKHNDTNDVQVTNFGDWGRWVNGGAWLTIDDQRVDFIYRSVDHVQQIIADCKAGQIELDYYQQPATGFYSYIYLGEVNICKPLYEADETIQNLKTSIAVYPPELKAKILKEFAGMARFALDHARKGMERLDTHTFVACLSRCVSCIIQLIYAINEEYFLSDKGAVQRCKTFAIVPDYFTERVEDIFFKPDAGSVDHCRNFLRELQPYLP